MLKASSLGHFPVLQFSRGYPSHPEMFRDVQGQFKHQANNARPPDMSIQLAALRERLRAPTEMNVGFPKEETLPPHCLWSQLLAPGKD